MRLPGGARVTCAAVAVLFYHNAVLAFSPTNLGVTSADRRKRGASIRSLWQEGQPGRTLSPLLAGKYKDEDFESLRPESSFGADAVPEGQRPVNEYMNMIEQPLFGWASQGDKALLTKLSIVYCVVFAAICYPIAGATFTSDGYELQKLASSNVGALSLLLLLMVRIYSGWGYVGARLQSKVIEYEETGWYDGDFEPKTEAELKRDKFLYLSDVKPVIDRVKLFSLSVGGAWLASCVALNVALNTKPLFDEYDPALLERVRYDDRLAGVAAEKSGSRPTYCDSRYYRAIANGGQGC